MLGASCLVHACLSIYLGCPACNGMAKLLEDQHSCTFAQDKPTAVLIKGS